LGFRNMGAFMRATLSARQATILAGLFLAATPAAAMEGTAQERSACIGDAFRFCSADIPDVPKIEACLGSNRSRLTPACQAEFHPERVKKTNLRAEHFR
jgi:hypothetical protein